MQQVPHLRRLFLRRTSMMLLVLSAGVLSSFCDSDDDDDKPLVATVIGVASVAPSAPKLDLGEVRLAKWSGDPSGSLNYEIIATIVNNGAGIASSFNAGATYKCPPGEPILSAGMDIVQAGYLPAGKSFTYRAPFHYQCLAHPPTLTLTVTIDTKDGQPKTYTPSPQLP